MSVKIYIVFRYLSAAHTTAESCNQDGLKKGASHVEILEEGESLTLGNALDASICLSDPSLSPYHCELSNQKDQLVFKDTSRSGTLVGGKKISAGTLQPEQFYRFLLANRIEVSCAYTIVAKASVYIESKPIPREGLLGKSLGEYRIDSLLTEGTSAYIFKGVQLPVGRPVAIKILKNSAPCSSKKAQRFQRVGRLVARLSHPALPTLYHTDMTLLEINQEKFNIFYFVFELIEGTSLEEILAQKKRLSIEEACDIVSQVAGVLLYMHTRKIVHRNLAPANIMLDKESQVKLTGIGLLKDLDDKEHQTLTGIGSQMGIKEYAPLEQMEDARKADHRADIFSLGAIFYHCLCGRPPYTLKTAQNFTKPITDFIRELQKPPVPPEQHNHMIPSALTKIILKCLEQEPSRRYQTLQDFIVDVQKHLKGTDYLADNFYAILPPCQYKNDYLEMHVLYRPLQNVGGDFYYYIPAEGDKKRLSLLVGDITDHGPGAAVLVGMMIASAKLIAKTTRDPQMLLEDLHETVFPLFRSSVSAEMVCLLLDFQKKQITFSQAGILPVILFHHDTRQVEVLQKRGTRVALLRNFFCETTKVSYNSGDILLLATDGIREAEIKGSKESQYGMGDIERLLAEHGERSCQDIAELIFKDVEQSCQITDDVTVVCVRLK